MSAKSAFLELPLSANDVVLYLPLSLLCFGFLDFKQLFHPYELASVLLLTLLFFVCRFLFCTCCDDTELIAEYFDPLSYVDLLEIFRKLMS